MAIQAKPYTVQLSGLDDDNEDDFGGGPAYDPLGNVLAAARPVLPGKGGGR